MINYAVKLNFNDGSQNYDLPLVNSITDPVPAVKDTIISGVRADGAIVIPGGKRPTEITVRGNIVNNLGYADLTTDIGTMRTSITTNVATLTLSHYSGGTWVTDWAFTVKRVGEIQFSPDNLRTSGQEYQITFLVIAF